MKEVEGLEPNQVNKNKKVKVKLTVINNQSIKQTHSLTLIRLFTRTVLSTFWDQATLFRWPQPGTL